MKYRDIVSVTGMSGLYQLLATKSDGAIVRNIGEKAIKFISARQHNVTPLESIEVYTIGDNVRLEYVFSQMMKYDQEGNWIDIKTATKDQITAFFKAVLPEFDEDRVYASDMKKMIKWYELLKSNDLLGPDEAEEVAQDNAAATETTEVTEATTDAESPEATAGDTNTEE